MVPCISGFCSPVTWTLCALTWLVVCTLKNVDQHGQAVSSPAAIGALVTDPPVTLGGAKRQRRWAGDGVIVCQSMCMYVTRHKDLLHEQTETGY